MRRDRVDPSSHLNPQNFRQRLTGDMVLHVSPKGDDSNSGISPEKPLRTLNAFYRRVRNDIDIAGHKLVAQLADGDYQENEISCVAATIGAVQVFVQGNERDPSAVRIRCDGGRNLFFSRDLGITTLRNLTVGTRGKGSRLISVTALSTIDLDAVWFEAAPEGIHIAVVQGFLVVQNDYRILGGAARHLLAAENGVVHYGKFTVQIPQPLIFDDFLLAESGALITAGGEPMKFEGAGVEKCAGRKFHVVPPALLLGSGTEFPGDKPGTIKPLEDALWNPDIHRKLPAGHPLHRKYYEVGRQRLSGDMVLHVSTSGDDGNSGYSPHQALRTLNEFYQRVRNDYDLAGHKLMAQMADGEYEEDEIACVAATVGAVQVFVVGNERDAGAVRIRCNGGRNLFYTRDFGVTTLRNVTLGTTGARSCLLSIGTSSTIVIDGVCFEAAPEGIHIFVRQGFFLVQNNYTIFGGAARHLSASENGIANYGGFTVTVPHPVAFDDFVVAESGALISSGGSAMTFVGDGLAQSTGRRFTIVPPGRLFSSGTQFPGSEAGIIAPVADDARWYN